MSIKDDIEALEKALSMADPLDRENDVRQACSPDRIRRLLDALDEEVTRANLAFSAQERAESQLSKACELLKEGKGIWEIECFDDLEARADAILREAGHE